MLRSVDRQPFETASIKTGDITTHVTMSGAGPPMLLLHGAGPGIDALLNWTGSMSRLGRDFRCIAPDLAGFGRTSQPPAFPQGAAAWSALRARQILALMDALGLKTASIIGNSRGGGATLLHLLCMAPERCERAIVMGGGGVPVAVAIDTPQAARVLDFYANPTLETMVELMGLFIHDATTLPEPLRAMATRRYANAIAPGAEAAYKSMMPLPAFPEELIGTLRRMPTPTLLVHGANDLLSAPASSLAVQAILPNAHLHIIPRAGHWPHVDRPGAFEALTRAFVKGQLD